MKAVTNHFLPYVLLCLGMLMPASPCRAADDSVPLPPAERDAFLARLEEELAGVTSLQVRFRQERELALLAEPAVSEGVLAFVRPDRLHWEWISPYPSLLVLNHGRVERFEVVDGDPRPLRASGAEMLRSIAVQMTHWLQGRFRASSEMFRIEVFEGPPSRIVLLPVAESLHEVLSRVEVELGDNPRVAQVVLRSPRGETTVMRYSDEQRGAPLADSLFDIARPQLIGGSVVRP